VVRRFKNGRKAATHSSVKLARLWNIIFDLCDDFSNPSSQVQLEWMPSHTTASQIGKIRKGNGAKLTETDRKGNAEADRLAKVGANSHRVPKATRRWALTADRAALRAALQLGITTHAANNHPVETIAPCGKVTTSTARDSEGMGKRARAHRPPEQLATASAPRRAGSRKERADIVAIEKRNRIAARELKVIENQMKVLETEDADANVITTIDTGTVLPSDSLPILVAGPRARRQDRPRYSRPVAEKNSIAKKRKTEGSSFRPMPSTDSISTAVQKMREAALGLPSAEGAAADKVIQDRRDAAAATAAASAEAAELLPSSSARPYSLLRWPQMTPTGSRK
jgi:hypothetical protein